MFSRITARRPQVSQLVNPSVFGFGASRGALLLGVSIQWFLVSAQAGALCCSATVRDSTDQGESRRSRFQHAGLPARGGVLVAVRQRRSRGSATSFLVILLRPPLRASICVIGSGRDMTMSRRRPWSGSSGGRGACSLRGFLARRLAFPSWGWTSHPVGDPSSTFEPQAARDGPCFSFGTAGWA